MSFEARRDDLSVNAPPLLMSCGIVGLIGCIALVASNVIGSMLVPDHDWVADTVSDLGAGEYEIIQDTGLHLYAAGLLACAIGAAHHHLGRGRWSLGILSLAILALCVEIVGVRNEYGDGDEEGIVVHTWIVYGLGVFFTAAPLLMAKGLGRVSGTFRWISIVCAILWAICAPIFFFLPTSIDGIWERGLGVITMVWVGTLSWVLYDAGRRLAEEGMREWGEDAGEAGTRQS